jgi:hypothetical protein
MPSLLTLSEVMFVIEGATPIDLYDKPHFPSQVVEQLVAFFGEHL